MAKADAMLYTGAGHIPPLDPIVAKEASQNLDAAIRYSQGRTRRAIKRYRRDREYSLDQLEYDLKESTELRARRNYG